MRRAGNPNWGKEQSAVVVPTEFERMVSELGLAPDQYLASESLRAWAATHKNTRYVPESLLKAWGMAADASM